MTEIYLKYLVLRFFSQVSKDKDFDVKNIYIDKLIQQNLPLYGQLEVGTLGAFELKLG